MPFSLADINPVKILTTDTETRRVVEQINVELKKVEENNVYLEGILNATQDASQDASDTLNMAIIAEVTNDFDLTYDDNGEIIVDG